MPTRSAAEVIERSANGSIARTLNRKTSLLRIVPTACGQAADIATGMTRCAGDFRRRAAQSCCDARRLRIDRDVTSRSILGAILPLHDVRYHTCASGFTTSWRKRKDVLCERAETRLVEPDGIEPTTSCLQSRRSPN